MAGFHRVLSSSITILLCLAVAVAALPSKKKLERDQYILTSNHDPTACDDISIYTPDWFLQHTKPAFRQEFRDKAIFYTRGAGEQARELACSDPEHYVTIWNIWPDWLYDNVDTVTNSLRCIHRDRDLQTKFYENMSSAYAQMARSHAYIMHTLEDFAAPPIDGIWGRIELPIVTNGTDITQLWKWSNDQTLRDEMAVLRKPAKEIWLKAIERVTWLWTQLRGSEITKRSLENDDTEDDAGSCKLWDRETLESLDSLF